YAYTTVSPGSPGRGVVPGRLRGVRRRAVVFGTFGAGVGLGFGFGAGGGGLVNTHCDQAVDNKPEKPRLFPWHQDTGYTFVEPQHYLTAWVALTDATVANGCPWILPRVHPARTLLPHATGQIS